MDAKCYFTYVIDGIVEYDELIYITFVTCLFGFLMFLIISTVGCVIWGIIKCLNKLSEACYNNSDNVFYNASSLGGTGFMLYASLMAENSSTPECDLNYTSTFVPQTHKGDSRAEYITIDMYSEE
jgi:hypothetical protein